MEDRKTHFDDYVMNKIEDDHSPPPTYSHSSHILDSPHASTGRGPAYGLFKDKGLTNPLPLQTGNQDKKVGTMIQHGRKVDNKLGR